MTPFRTLVAVCAIALPTVTDAQSVTEMPRLLRPDLPAPQTGPPSRTLASRDRGTTTLPYSVPPAPDPTPRARPPRANQMLGSLKRGARRYDLVCQTGSGYCRGVTTRPIAAGTACRCGEAPGVVR